MVTFRYSNVLAYEKQYDSASNSVGNTVDVDELLLSPLTSRASSFVMAFVLEMHDPV